jgi:5-bromo-4-chloroindolyl phosphate hydrolysis protein
VPSEKVIHGGGDINKTRFIGFRVTEKDYKKIKKKADEANLNVSQYATLSTLEKEILNFEELEEINYKLSKLGNNINQLTMLAHQGRLTSIDFTEFTEAFSGMWDELVKLTERG